MRELISIIVPVYNVENYLNRCVQSLITQTYKNLEIILVDDGSLDSSGKLCDEWKQKDKRIKVVHKENGGLSDARNAGLDVCKGKFVGFIDSDDFIDMSMFEKLYSSIQNNQSDIAICGLNYYYDDNRLLQIKETNLKNVNHINLIELYFNNNTIHHENVIQTENISSSVCRCLYKRSLIDNLRFIKGLLSEDFVFNIQLLDKKPKFSVVESLYYYYQRENSIVHSYDLKKLNKRIEFSKQIIKVVDRKVSKELYKSICFYLYEMCVIDCLRAKNFKELFRIILDDETLKEFRKYKNYKARIKQIKNRKKRLSCLLLLLGLLKLYRKLYLHFTKS